MKKIISLFVKYPFYANIIIFAILGVGIVSFATMKRSFFPDIKEKIISISVAYPGASPKEMEEGVTIRIEESIRGIAGIKEVTSSSSENFANIQIETTGVYDIDETLMEVKNAIDGITSMPVDAEKPVVSKVRSRSMAMYMGLSGETDLLTLKNYADIIENDLYNSGILSQFTITGYPALELSVEVSEENLLRYNLTFDQIARAINQNNLDISGGQIRSDEEEMMIRSRYRSVEPEDIEQIIIKANQDGSKVRIKDVGIVKLQFADVSNRSYMNGTPSISFQINKLPNEDLSKISAFINEYVDKFNATHTDAQLQVTFDFLDMLKERLNLLYKNGGMGLILILITLGLFLSLRLSFWVAFGIPSSFLAMFILANVYGITINMISLFGMILVIGILVDDGIVIAENIYSHFEAGKSPKQAAIDGTMEVLPAIVTSVLTTIVAFSPLFFITGQMEFMFEMAFVVVFSLAFSLLEAFFVLPAHLGSHHILRRKEKENTGKKIRRALDHFLDFLRSKMYGNTLRFIIKWKYVFAFLPIVLIMITAGLFGGGFIKSTFFPSIPFDQFNVDVAFKPGSGEKQTLEFVRQFDEAIWEVNQELMDEFNDTVPFINYTFSNIGQAFGGQETGSHAGNVFVTLKELDKKEISSFDIMNRVKKKIGEVPEASKFAISGRNTFGSPVSISLLSRDLDELENAKELLLRSLDQISAITNITDANAAGKREVLLKLKPKAYFLGFTQASLTNQVRQGFFGAQAQRLQKGKDELRVWVRYPKSGRLTIGQLEEMKIKTPMGEYPLSELADYSFERGPVSIKHFNGVREVRITADMTDPNEPVPPVLARVKAEIVPEIMALYPGVTVDFQGQSRSGDETMTQIVSYFGGAFLLMFLIIIIHFKSVLQGFIIVAMIPLAWIGAAWGHGIENAPVSLFSAWGMIALSGVIINDAVVFLAKYNDLLLEGRKVTEAVYETGQARFRAIVLTTITTVVGLYPIILEKSFQAQFLKPMAIALAYGVLIGTGFILTFFPVTILVTNDIKRVFKYIGNRKKLWVKMGEKVDLPDAEEIAELKRFPSRESVENVIVLQKNSID